jgi:hypothetical protein
LLVATNFTDPVQSITIGAAGLFADHITSTLKPKARDVAAIREFLVLGNTNDTTDGDVPYRVWWSAYRDSLDFDPAAATQCDFEDRPAGGHVQRIIGGAEYGLVFQQERLVRMSYAGSPAIFQFDEIDRKRGTPVPNSVIGHGLFVYWLSDEGFYMTDGLQSTQIGHNQIDRTFQAAFDVASGVSMSAAIDPANKIVAWLFPANGSTSPNKIYFYNWEDRRWSEADVALELLANTTTEGFTLEGLDAVALDSAADTTISVNEAAGQTVISVTSVTGFAVDDTVRITLNDATVHQAQIDAVGASDITIDVALPSASDAGKRVVRTTIDALTPGLDSPQWQGGGIAFGAFDTTHKLGYFSGANLEATIETGDHEVFTGQQAVVTKLRPLVDGGTISAAVAGRNRILDTVTFDGSHSLDATGEIDALNEARYHRLRVSIAASGVWSHAQGVQVIASPLGRRS